MEFVQRDRAENIRIPIYKAKTNPEYINIQLRSTSGSHIFFWWLFLTFCFRCFIIENAFASWKIHSFFLFAIDKALDASVASGTNVSIEWIFLSGVGKCKCAYAYMHSWFFFTNLQESSFTPHHIDYIVRQTKAYEVVPDSEFIWKSYGYFNFTYS